MCKWRHKNVERMKGLNETLFQGEISLKGKKNENHFASQSNWTRTRKCGRILNERKLRRLKLINAGNRFPWPRFRSIDSNERFDWSNVGGGRRGEKKGKKQKNKTKIAHLAFSTKLFEQLVRFEFGLLIKNDSRHTEEEARQLLKDGRRFKR